MKSQDPLDNLRIASPCPVGWEQMTGDERTRLCQLCDLHVYNISEMTRKEAVSLIATREGRICARLFRRTDGTIITRDCPVGLRAIRRRVAKTATAVFATIMTLCASVAGQKPEKADKNSCQSQVKITRTIADAQPAGAMALLILDANGAVLVGAEIALTESVERPHTLDVKAGSTRRQTTNDEGRVVFTGLAPGHYDVKVDVESRGFQNFVLQDLDVKAKETLAVDITVLVAEGGGVVGLLTLPLLIEKPAAGMMIITGDVLRKLPY